MTFINCDKHNMATLGAQMPTGYCCNCCGRMVSKAYAVSRKDGSNLICYDCVDGMAKILNTTRQYIMACVKQEG